MDNNKIEEHPKLFISYSWSSPEHQQWVLQLAIELRESGVDVTLDKWDLKEGHDALAFMEKMVSDPEIKKVLIVCDKKYVEKADGRSGGVGTETQIISPEIYQKENQDKFVAVIKEKDEEGKPYRPVYYKSRIFIDMSEESSYTEGFEQLLRWVYDKPLYIKPEIGKKPSYLEESDAILFGTSAKFKRLMDAIKNGKSYVDGALTEYLDSIVTGFEMFRITKYEGELDDEVIRKIEQFIPLRNELLEVFQIIAQYRDSQETSKQLHRFFERLIPYLDKPESVKIWNERDFDNYKFIIHELFIYCIAIMLKYECFNTVSHLMENRYYNEHFSLHGINLIDYSIFRPYLESLTERSKRLNLSPSLHSSLLRERFVSTGITFDQFMQADFVLYVRNVFFNLNKISTMSDWYPYLLHHLHYKNTSFEIFSRSVSITYFENIKKIFSINNKEELLTLFDAYNKGYAPGPRRMSLHVLMGYEHLDTIP